MSRFLLRAAALALALLASAACTPRTEAPTVSADQKALSRLIKLPFPAKSVHWQVTKPAEHQGGLGPDDWALVAVLTFSPEERQSLLRIPVTVDTGYPGTSMPAWLPPPLRALWQKQATGTATPGTKAFDASALYRPPLQHGYLIPFGDDGSVLLYLYTQ